MAVSGERPLDADVAPGQVMVRDHHRPQTKQPDVSILDVVVRVDGSTSVSAQEAMTPDGARPRLPTTGRRRVCRSVRDAVPLHLAVEAGAADTEATRRLRLVAVVLEQGLGDRQAFGHVEVDGGEFRSSTRDRHRGRRPVLLRRQVRTDPGRQRRRRQPMIQGARLAEQEMLLQMTALDDADGGCQGHRVADCVAPVTGYELHRCRKVLPKGARHFPGSPSNVGRTYRVE